MKTIYFPFSPIKSSNFILPIAFFLISCSDNNIPHIAYYDNGIRKRRVHSNLEKNMENGLIGTTMEQKNPRVAIKKV